MCKKGNPFINNNEIVFKTENDSARAVQHVVAEALVYPDLKDKGLMEFYNCHDIAEMPRTVFSHSNEYAHVQREVFKALGLTRGSDENESKKVIEEVKN